MKKSRKNNHVNSVISENIVLDIINNKTEHILRVPLLVIIEKVFGQFNNILAIKCAGRNYNYDFIFKINGTDYKIEWKDGATSMFTSRFY